MQRHDHPVRLAHVAATLSVTLPFASCPRNTPYAASCLPHPSRASPGQLLRCSCLSGKTQARHLPNKWLCCPDKYRQVAPAGQVLCASLLRPACTVHAGAAVSPCHTVGAAPGSATDELTLGEPRPSVPQRWRRSRGWRASACCAANTDLCLFVLSTYIVRPRSSRYRRLGALPSCKRQARAAATPSVTLLFASGPRHRPCAASPTRHGRARAALLLRSSCLSGETQA